MEENNGINDYLTSKYDSKYTELSSLDFDETNESAVRLLKKVSSERNLAAYIGYPVMIESFYSMKSNQTIYKIAPVFLFAIDTTGGAVKSTPIPSVNMEVIKQYSSRDINSQVYDLVELETELGLNNADADIEIDEMVARLQVIRQWQWREPLNPECLSDTPSVEKITEEGIYNRAIMIVAERSPYTIGAGKRTFSLMSTDENSYKGTALYKWIHQGNKNERFRYIYSR